MTNSIRPVAVASLLSQWRSPSDAERNPAQWVRRTVGAVAAVSPREENQVGPRDGNRWLEMEWSEDSMT